ncbi:MAG: hypothetical protein IJ498_08475 [Akkermansia sp.]|nr:hypothetical protein [Akkermansia sp.]
MKGSHYVIIGAASLAVVSCVQPYPVPTVGNTPQANVVPAAPARSGQYIALPGQAVQSVTTDTDAAFEQQVVAYTQGTAAPVGVPAVVSLAVPQTPMVSAAPVTTPDPMQAPVAAVPAVVQPVAAPTPVTTPMVTTPGMSVGTPDPAVGGNISYNVNFVNNTPGRLFIEAQDAKGEIYPCGFISPMQSIKAPMQNVAPIKGPITVVVRDPDKPDTPEIRRYKVEPPAQYAGRTIGIAVIPGGIYQTSLDGVVVYTSPPQPRVVQPAPAPAPAPEQPAPAAALAPAAATPAP